MQLDEQIQHRLDLVGDLKDKNNDTMQKDNTEELLQIVRNIKAVQCKHSSEQIVKSLRDGSLSAELITERYFLGSLQN